MAIDFGFAKKVIDSSAVSTSRDSDPPLAADPKTSSLWLKIAQKSCTVQYSTVLGPGDLRLLLMIELLHDFTEIQQNPRNYGYSIIFSGPNTLEKYESLEP